MMDAAEAPSSRPRRQAQQAPRPAGEGVVGGGPGGHRRPASDLGLLWIHSGAWALGLWSL